MPKPLTDWDKELGVVMIVPNVVVLGGGSAFVYLVRSKPGSESVVFSEKTIFVNGFSRRGRVSCGFLTLLT